MTPPKVAVVGAGNWGSNLVRNFHALSSLHTVCDKSADIQQKVKNHFPTTEITDNYDDILQNPDIDGVNIVTPSSTHTELAEKALRADKHVFVEKPIAFSTKEVSRLGALAEEANLTLMVGHLLLYHPVLNELEKLMSKDELGDLRYAYATRVNLGVVRTDANVVWNLMIHDLSVMLELFPSQPSRVSAEGKSFVQDGLEDVVFATVEFEDGQMVHLHASWLDPHKVRRMTFVGDEKMAVFDDIKGTDKLALHKKGVKAQLEETHFDDFSKFLSTYHGDTIFPAIEMDEPLKLECQAFLNAIEEGKTPRTDWKHALEVTHTLEAIETSLDNNGETILLEEKSGYGT